MARHLDDNLSSTWFFLQNVSVLNSNMSDNIILCVRQLLNKTIQQKTLYCYDMSYTLL